MDNSRDLQLILRSRVPLVVVESRDEGRILEMLQEFHGTYATDNYQALFRWTVTEGLQRVDIALAAQKHNAEPTDVLKHIRAVDLPGTFVLLDFHPYLRDPMHVRLLKDICLGYERTPRTVVLLSHELELPVELKHFSASFELALPAPEEREAILKEVAAEYAREHPGERVQADRKAFRMLVENLAGLPMADTRRLARNAIYADGAITSSDLPAVMQAKYELLNRSGVLSYEYETAGFSEVGGLGRLKRWLEQRKAAFHGDQSAAHLDPPRGVMLLGVQGCGKSLAAKATAGVYGVPLLRLDFGSLYNKYHGESERNLREALNTAAVMTPCVLWIDEIEKGVAHGDSDGGTSRRILGTFLTWLAEKDAKVFVVATANDISVLPPELVRKGRFDEIFFVDLPQPPVRAEIFRIHLARRQLDPGQFGIAALVAASDGFSGAEIEQAVVSALYTAHARSEPPAKEHVVEELGRTKPLSVVMAERISTLRRWAAHRTVPSD